MMISKAITKFNLKFIFLKVLPLVFSIWLSMKLFNYVFPSKIFCGYVVDTPEKALSISLKSIQRGLKIRNDLRDDNKLENYINSTRDKSIHTKTRSTAIYRSYNCCFAEKGGAIQRYWDVTVTLPSSCGYLVEWWMQVWTCGGGLTVVGTTPSSKNPDVSSISGHC